MYQYDPPVPTPDNTFEIGSDDNAQMRINGHATFFIENADFAILDADNVFLMPFT